VQLERQHEEAERVQQQSRDTDVSGERLGDLPEGEGLRVVIGNELRRGTRGGVERIWPLRLGIVEGAVEAIPGRISLRVGTANISNARIARGRSVSCCLLSQGANIGTLEVGASEVGLGKVGRDDGALQVRVLEVGSGKDSANKVSIPQVGPSETRARKVGCSVDFCLVTGCLPWFLARGSRK
jgi:hypothetical protein